MALTSAKIVSLPAPIQLPSMIFSVMPSGASALKASGNITSSKMPRSPSLPGGAGLRSKSLAWGSSAANGSISIAGRNMKKVAPSQSPYVQP